MNSAKKDSRKWKVTKYSIALETLPILISCYKLILTNDGSVITALATFIGACLLAVAGTLGFYFNANVKQKNTIGNTNE